MSNPTNFEQIREKAQEIGQHAKTDKAFLHELQSNPVETLRNAGLPEEGISGFLAEEGFESEVSGYQMIEDMGCVCTGCCITTIIL